MLTRLRTVILDVLLPMPIVVVPFRRHFYLRPGLLNHFVGGHVETARKPRRSQRRLAGRFLRRWRRRRRRHGALELSLIDLLLLVVDLLLLMQLLLVLPLPLGMQFPLEREPCGFGGRLGVVVKPLRLEGQERVT